MHKVIIATVAFDGLFSVAGAAFPADSSHKLLLYFFKVIDGAIVLNFSGMKD